MRGKESLVLIRPSQGGLMMHTMFFQDEVRDFGEIDKGSDATVRPGELDLALRLIDELANPEFRPDQYHDEYRGRVLSVVEQGRGQGDHLRGASGRAQGDRPHGGAPRSLENRGAPADGDGAKKPPAKAIPRPAAKDTAAPAARRKATAKR